MRKTPHFKGMHQIGPIGSMFYWGFHAKHNPDKTPLLVYFPEDGMMPEIFYGNGPFRIVKGKVEENVNSWHGLLNVVYVDTPIGQELSKASFDGMPKRPYEQAQNIVDLIFSLAFLVPS
jgi:carboxypeptidase C (cathepsin A)